MTGTKQSNTTTEGEARDASQDSNSLRVLISSDLHLGFLEKDPIRKDDSFAALEEILSIARDEKVDFILFGGDLFHDNKPSRSTYHRTLLLLRQYALGDGEISFDVVSDRKLFHSNSLSPLNYEDPNYNVKIPIFTIHGNHDDPSGDGQLSPLDLLSDANLINYFGRAENLDNIVVEPVLIVKGETKVALYGLGSVRDERLNRSFQQDKIKFSRPLVEPESWFNIMVLHQNRPSHSPKSAVHESMLPTFLDLVVWGHEHECKIVPEPCASSDFFIIQPGSPIPTSLCEGEAQQKCVGILEIRGNTWSLEPKALKSSRPILRKDVSLLEIDSSDPKEEEIKDFLMGIVDRLIIEQSSPHGNGLLPLVRVRVEQPWSTRPPCPTPSRFGQHFVGRVANPDDILLIQKKKAKPQASNESSVDLRDDIDPSGAGDDRSSTDMNSLSFQIRQLMAGKENPLVLPLSKFEGALRLFVEKEEKNSFLEVINQCKKDTITLLEASLTLEAIENSTILENSFARTLASRPSIRTDSSVASSSSATSVSSTLFSASPLSSLSSTPSKQPSAMVIKNEPIDLSSSPPPPVGAKRVRVPPTKNPTPKKKTCLPMLIEVKDCDDSKDPPVSGGWGMRKLS